MNYLIIVVVVLVFALLIQSTRMKYWKRKSKIMYRNMIIEKHKLQHEIEQLKGLR